MNTLIKCGTPAAVEAIRSIHENVPDERLKHVEQMAREVVRQKTWTPLSPSELIDLVTGMRTKPTNTEGVEPNAANGLEPSGMPPNAEPGLASRLKEAEKISDLRLRGMYEAVIRYYGWYFTELRGLKRASKKYRTPELLKVQFPDLEVWKVLDRMMWQMSPRASLFRDVSHGLWSNAIMVSAARMIGP